MNTVTSSTVTVLGATGQVGRQVVAGLRARGATVRAVARPSDRLTALDAEPRPGLLTDTAFLTAACTGADAVFVLLPPDSDAPDHPAAQAAAGRAIAEAVRASGVQYAVQLSSLGGEVAEGTGFLAGLHDQEERMRATGVPLLVLRPGWFAENVAAAIPVVEEHGVLADSLAPGRALPVVATRDVAAAAVEALLDRSETGVRELLGPADLTPEDMADALGAALGRPGLPYVRLPDEDMAAALVGAGFSPSAAAGHLGMTAALNAGRVVSRSGRTPRTTTPTPLADVLAGLPG
jgi:uncharacterized protein YbjT (DUF2867 family)